MASTDRVPAPAGPRRRVRVLLLVDQLHDHGAGAERLVFQLALNLPQDLFEVTLCTTRTGEGKVIEELRGHGVRHLHLGRRWVGDLHRLAPLVMALRRERIDVLHSHMFGSNFWGAVLGRAAGVPVVVAHEHAWSYEGNRTRRLIDGYVIGRLVDAFVAVSRAGRDRMVEVEGVPADKIHVIPNAWFPRAVEHDGRDLRAELGLAPRTPLVGTVALLRPQKALEVLIDAFALVRREVPAAHLVIAGGGECRTQLEEHTQRRHLTEAVHFLGYRSDADAVWSSLDVGAMSSDWEGMPLSALEAMAQGRALAVTAVGGLPELLEDGRTALMVPPRDPAALAEAITTLLEDADRRHRLGQAALERSRDFTPERLSARVGELYTSLLKRKGHLADS